MGADQTRISEATYVQEYVSRISRDHLEHNGSKYVACWTRSRLGGKLTLLKVVRSIRFKVAKG